MMLSQALRCTCAVQANYCLDSFQREVCLNKPFRAATTEKRLTCWFGSGAVFVAVELVRRSCCSFGVTILSTVSAPGEIYTPAGRPEARCATSSADVFEL